MNFPAIPEREHSPLADAMYDIAEALKYPVDHRGRRYDIAYLTPILSYHLARMGCVIDPERAIIKQRRVPPPPEFAGSDLWDAVEYVHVDAPMSIDDELHGATLDDLPRMSAAARAEFIRRAGGEPPKPPALQDPTDEEMVAAMPWRVQTSIQFDDDEESPK